GDLAILELVDVSGDGDWEIGERLHVVDELFMPRAVDRARLVRQPTGRLSTFPGATVDEDDIPPLLAHDEPVTDHRQKARRFGVRPLARAVDVDATLRAAGRRELRSRM